jgi:hypothetical protein
MVAIMHTGVEVLEFPKSHIWRGIAGTFFSRVLDNILRWMTIIHLFGGMYKSIRDIYGSHGY